MGNRRLKIAQVSPYYVPSIGGVVGVVQYISEELIKRGHEVVVYTANRDHKERSQFQLAEMELINGVAVKRFSSILNIGHMSVCPREIFELYRNEFDIIHSHVYRHPHGDIAALIGRKKGTPIIMHGHGPFFCKSSLSKTKWVLYTLYDRTVSREMFRLVDRIFALTQDERQCYVNLGARVEQVIVIPNAASDECFLKVNPSRFIQKHNLLDKRIILYLSTLNAFKRPDLLIKVLPMLIRKVPNSFVVFAGPDAGMMRNINALAEELGVKDHYKWVGPLQGKEKQEAMEAADIFALPSDEEPFGMVIVEAMAHGKPVISTDATGPSEIVVHGQTGFIMRRGNADELGNAAIQILTSKSLQENMGKAARALAIKKYTVGRVVDQIEKTYLDLLGNSKHKQKDLHVSLQ